MLTTNAFAEIGSLLGDPARASMVVALMDGRALTATELSAIAGITPQTASSHLSQLVTSGLIAMKRQGRHRYHCLASPAIARMVEGMMAVASDSSISRKPAVHVGPRDQAMRRARTCYDHLAGRIAVAIADAMVTRGEVDWSADGVVGQFENSCRSANAHLRTSGPRKKKVSGSAMLPYGSVRP